MNKLTLALSLFLLLRPVPIVGQTIISEDISEDQIWSLAQSPYIIQGSIEIQAGVTLSIEPGVEVRFEVFG